MSGYYEMWAWLVMEADGSEGVIAAEGLIEGRMVPLQSRNPTMAEMMRPVAKAHGEQSGKPVRLVHLIEVD